MSALRAIRDSDVVAFCDALRLSGFLYFACDCGFRNVTENWLLYYIERIVHVDTRIAFADVFRAWTNSMLRRDDRQPWGSDLFRLRGLIDELHLPLSRR